MAEMKKWSCLGSNSLESIIDAFLSGVIEKRLAYE